jgi:predicted CoA-binding protein
MILARASSAEKPAMSHDYCPLPAEPNDAEEIRAIAEMLAAQRIAIVGASDDPFRASNQIASYLLARGKQVIPINPNHDEVLGLKCYPSLRDAPGPIEVVNVFRRPEFCADVARETIEIGAKGIWLQSGIRNEEAQRLAREAGLLFVQHQCIMVQHMRQAHE